MKRVLILASFYVALMWRRPSMTKTCTCIFWRDDGLCSCPCTRKRQHALHQWKHRAFTDREWQYQRSAENQPCGTHGFNAKYLVEPGDIRPEKISIHGASPYQNAYLIDGISATNNLNPANESDASSATNISGMSQGYYLDVSLLDNVTLYDSFVLGWIWSLQWRGNWCKDQTLQRWW